MTANRLIRALLILWTATLPATRAQDSSTADHKQSDGPKAQANKAEVDALIALAARYASGDGVPKDLVKAAKLHRKAAELGDARGECLLGLDYANGEGLKKNMNEAARWLHKAADQGYEMGQYKLAVMYANGHGVKQDYSEAAAWYRKAAEKGDARAQADLGVLYFTGRGTEQNLVLSHMWLSLSAAKCNHDAAKHLAKVSAKMTPAQIGEADRLAREREPDPHCASLF